MAESILERYIAQRSPALRNQLVEANLGIAAAVARKFVGRGVEYDDLYQVASFALLKAIERYDPDRGVKLTSFVVPSITGEKADEKRMAPVSGRYRKVTILPRLLSSFQPEARGESSAPSGSTQIRRPFSQTAFSNSATGMGRKNT